jgi:hypothetical protein
MNRNEFFGKTSLNQNQPKRVMWGVRSEHSKAFGRGSGSTTEGSNISPVRTGFKPAMPVPRADSNSGLLHTIIEAGEELA